MLFTTTEFFVLLGCTLVLYYRVSAARSQIAVLILSSLVFYSWTNPFLLTLLIGSATINAVISRLLCTSRVDRQRRWIAILGVVANLGVLGFFKYGPLVSQTFFQPETTLGEFLLAIPLPIGISFYTFQGISLVVDTFRDQSSQQVVGATEPVKTGLFIVFFPQLIAGPIVKSKDFLPQIGHKRFRDIDWELVTRRLVTGYFLKMVVADNLRDLTIGMQYPYFLNRPSIDLLWMLVGYSMQIFADFAGYSLIAIGLAGLFGYRLRDNFLFPYYSRSFAEFWRRWHISLSSFLKEYLYIPLGGNRLGAVRTYVNLFVVMLLGGLWHGAAWSYVVWGAYHGAALVIERMILGDRRSNWSTSSLGCVVSAIFVFCIVTLGWLLFVLPEFGHVVLYVKCIATNRSSFAFQSMFPFLMIAYCSPVVGYHLFDLLRRSKYSQAAIRCEPLFLGTMLFLTLTNSGSSGDFIYFQF